MERQSSDDTKGFDQIGGTTFDATPTNVAELATLPGGFTRNNQPTTASPAGVPAKTTVNPSLRGIEGD